MRSQPEQVSRQIPVSPLPSSSCFRACGHYCPPDCFYHLYKSLLAQTQRNEQTCKDVNLWLSPPPRERTEGHENKGGWGETDRDVERERIKKRQVRSQLYTHLSPSPTHATWVHCELSTSVSVVSLRIAILQIKVFSISIWVFLLPITDITASPCSHFTFYIYCSQYKILWSREVMFDDSK